MGRYPERYRQAGISAARLMELRGICRQYRELQRRLRLAHAGIEDRERRGNAGWHRPDPTAAEAAALADHPAARRLALIDRAVDTAGAWLRPAILQHIADGHSYEQIVPPPPCGINQFYRTVQDVYIALDALLRGEK